MPTDRPDIFSDNDKKRLKDTLTDINKALPLLDDAEACGIECQALRADLEKRRQQLENIRSRFMVGDTGRRRKKTPG